jgi:hypothetical protein
MYEQLDAGTYEGHEAALNEMFGVNPNRRVLPDGALEKT